MDIPKSGGKYHTIFGCNNNVCFSLLIKGLRKYKTIAFKPLEFKQCNSCKLYCKPRWCTRCSEVNYCSIICQKKEWDAHKIVCKKKVPKIPIIRKKVPIVKEKIKPKIPTIRRKKK